MGKHTKEKPKKKVSNIMLVLICTMIILYTIAAFALQYFVQCEISPTVTTAWYAFWGGELICLASIRITKVKYDNRSYTTEDTSETIEED
jgi:biotin transporter BioY